MKAIIISSQAFARIPSPCQRGPPERRGRFTGVRGGRRVFDASKASPAWPRDVVHGRGRGAWRERRTERLESAVGRRALPEGGATCRCTAGGGGGGGDEFRKLVSLATGDESQYALLDQYSFIWTRAEECLCIGVNSYVFECTYTYTYGHYRVIGMTCRKIYIHRYYYLYVSWQCCFCFSFEVNVGICKR